MEGLFQEHRHKFFSDSNLTPRQVSSAPLQADTLFSQATTSALDQVILQVKTTLNTRGH